MSAIRVYAFRCDEPGCPSTASTLETNATRARAVIARKGWTNRIVPTRASFPVYCDICPSHSERRAAAAIAAS